MTFRRLLISGYLAALLLILVTAATGIVALHVASAGAGTSARDLAEELALVHGLRIQSEEMAVASRGYLLTGESRYRATFDRSRAEFEHQIAALRGRSFDPEGTIDSLAIEQLSHAYTLASRRADAERSTMDVGALVPYFDATLQPLHDGLETAVSNFAYHERLRFDASLHRSEIRARDAEVVVAVAALLAIAIGCGLAIYVSRRVTSQFDRIAAAEKEARAAAAAREEVLAVVSHDLRNPLHAIVMGVSVMAESVRDERTRRQLQTVGNAAERMRNMIEELLQVARIDAHALVLQPAPMDARQLVDETLEMFQARATEHAIALRSEGPSTPIVCDHERVLEVLSNLVGNAFKFTPPGGEIVVKAEPRAHDVRFVVSDTGPGVDPAQVPHLFERHWQGRKRHDGLGLGLYICKQVIEAHHGAIGVDSHVGAGTAVWFTVPA